MIVDYFTILSSSSNLNITYILSDSCAAIDAVVRCKRSIRPESFKSLIDLRQVLYNMNIRVTLVQIQGHSGILGNDIVDKEAKQIAFQMFKGNIVSPEEGLLSASEAHIYLQKLHANHGNVIGTMNLPVDTPIYKSGAIQALYMKVLLLRN